MSSSLRINMEMLEENNELLRKIKYYLFMCIYNIHALNAKKISFIPNYNAVLHNT